MLVVPGCCVAPSREHRPGSVPMLSLTPEGPRAPWGCLEATGLPPPREPSVSTGLPGAAETTGGCGGIRLGRSKIRCWGGGYKVSPGTHMGWRGWGSAGSPPLSQAPGLSALG